MSSRATYGCADSNRRRDGSKCHWPKGDHVIINGCFEVVDGGDVKNMPLEEFLIGPALVVDV